LNEGSLQVAPRRCTLSVYEFCFPVKHNDIPNNWLTFHCAQLSLLVVQYRYMFRLMEPSTGDILTIHMLLNYASCMDPYIVLIFVLQ
jgi:hypothetical protein